MMPSISGAAMATDERANASMKPKASAEATSVYHDAPALSAQAMAIQPSQTKTVARLAGRRASFRTSTA